jgi:ligand-binding SRPBCC domain-containing protein
MSDSATPTRIFEPTRSNRRDRIFAADQWLPRPRPEVFAFFCDPRNLGRLTPLQFHFRIVEQSTRDIREGTEFEYRMRIRGIPIVWRSRITAWEENVFFADSQLRGPYARWDHTHRFEDSDGGTLIRDRVIYRLPFGWVGHLAGSWFVRREVESIFDFRRRQIETVFGGPGRPTD